MYHDKGEEIFAEDVNKLFHAIILDPYNLKDLRLLVVCARQDFINSVLKLQTLQLSRQEIVRKLIFPWRKTRKIDKALLAVQGEIRRKRLFLDDLERALKLASDNDYENLEQSSFFVDALREAENNDDVRYEKRLEAISEKAERLSELGLLSDIRRQIAEIYLFMEKTDYQKKRALEWKLYGPPSRVKNEYDKYKRESNTSENSKSPLTSKEADDIDHRVLCPDGSCIGIIGADGHCKVCGKIYSDKKS